MLYSLLDCFKHKLIYLVSDLFVSDAIADTLSCMNFFLPFPSFLYGTAHGGASKWIKLYCHSTDDNIGNYPIFLNGEFFGAVIPGGLYDFYYGGKKQTSDFPQLHLITIIFD